MRALVLHAERRGSLDLGDPASVPASTVWANPTIVETDVPDPEIVNPWDVVVRVSWCGICGSDLHCSTAGPEGFVSFGGPARLPVVLGHEFAGTVEETGRAVEHISKGDRVAVESVWACWECGDCRAGHPNECSRVELLGLTVNGALAPFVRVDSRHCHRLDRIADRFGWAQSLEIGALLEPLGVARRGLHRAGLHPGDRLVVVGTGPIGLGVILLARAIGVTDIVACDLNPSRVALARAAGARALRAATADEVRDGVRQALNGRQATLAVEAAGTPAAFAAAFASLANRGRLLVLGRMPGPVELDTNTLLTRGLTIVGSRGHAGLGIFTDLIAAMSHGSLDPTSLITAKFDWTDVRAAFAHARLGTGAKTLVRMEA